jgi:predicted nucleic acid-binding Zn ribbon protein
MECVACGAMIEPFGNHHCSEAFEKKREASERMRRADHVHVPQFYERLSTGFWMMRLSDPTRS